MANIVQAVSGVPLTRLCPCGPGFTERDLLYSILLAIQANGTGGGGGGGGGIAVGDGVYTVGLGVSQNGKLTIAGGSLTAIQQAQP